MGCLLIETITYKYPGSKIYRKNIFKHFWYIDAEGGDGMCFLLSRLRCIEILSVY